jgi:hypothetical protein
LTKHTTQQPKKQLPNKAKTTEKQSKTTQNFFSPKSGNPARQTQKIEATKAQTQ